MKVLVASPLRAMSGKIHSHRSAQGVIYAEQIKEALFWDKAEVHCNLTGPRYESDFNKFDVLYAYHGNDWSGSANLFGGLEGYPFTRNLANFSKFKGELKSINIDWPDLAGQLKPRFDKFVAKKGYAALPQAWKDVDWENLAEMNKRSKTVMVDDLIRHNCPKKEPKIVIGDSHAICMYRPGWQVNSVPFKTLYGALNMGFDEFLPLTLATWSEIEVYFGNIDLRHHLCRQPDPLAATKVLARRYVDECLLLRMKYGCDIRICELLPVENESRKLPKTGYYEGTPFYGTWSQRNALRDVFHKELERLLAQSTYKGITLYRWTSGLVNMAGELDFAHMEKPKSVHLSRAAYPHWQGTEWNGIVDDSEEDAEEETTGEVKVDGPSLEGFLS